MRPSFIQLKIQLVNYIRIDFVHTMTWKQHSAALWQSLRSMLRKDVVIRIWSYPNREQSYFETRRSCHSSTPTNSDCLSVTNISKMEHWT